MKPMKQLITILLYCCGTVLIAQNWSPILVNEKMNYQHNDSSYISHSIWVENVAPQGNDTIYELNKIVIDCPDEPEKVLRNQPSFLQMNVIKQDSGKYLFSNPNNYLILTKAHMWDSWIFDQANNIIATVNGHTLTDILGTPDSVKYIGLSDGSQLRISKNFGIIKIPDFENGGYFELVGIQDTEFGESVIDFWDIYDFEVGDVFQYDYTHGDASVFDYQTQKYTVESKDIFDDSIKYQMHYVIDGYWIDYWSWESYHYSYWGTKEICYIDSINHPSNKFNYELVIMWEDYWGYYFYDTSFSKVFLSKDSLAFRVKTMGSAALYPEVEQLYKEISSYEDTLIRIQSYPENLLVQYKEGLGRTIYDYWDFEQITYQHLEGYVKNGDTVGTITPDSLLLTKISEPKTIAKNWIIYPNPAQDWFHFKLSNTNSKVTYNIELRNLCGQLVKEEKNIQSTHYAMNVADLNAGVYFYVIRDGDMVLQQGKLIIK